MGPLRIAAAWAFTAWYWPRAVLPRLLRGRRLEPGEIAPLVRRWGEWMVGLLGLDLQLDNPCPFLIGDQPRVVVCSHQSGLDLAWGAVICPPRPYSAGKKELRYVPFLNLAWWSFRFILLDRFNTARDLAALRGVAREIREGRRSFLMAPEGTRSLDGEIGPFKKGAFHLALESGAPLYPVVVDGAFQSMPKGAWWPRRGRIRARFLEPIPTEGLGPDELPALVERTRAAMVAALHGMRRQDPPRVRAMRPRDAVAVTALGEQLGYVFSVEEARARLREARRRPDQEAWVAEKADGRVVGWAQAGWRSTLAGGAGVEVLGLVVDREERGSGVGTRLMAQVERWAFGRGAAFVRLNSRIQREEAHRFYEKLGYARLKTSHVFAKGPSGSTGA
jgi:1-acyl-sn-glycerol-3-phosphate acyltransferase